MRGPHPKAPWASDGVLAPGVVLNRDDGAHHSLSRPVDHQQGQHEHTQDGPDALASHLQGTLSPRPSAVEALERVSLLVPELLFPCNFRWLCTPAGVHPNPLVGPASDLVLDASRGRRGERH